MEFEENERRKVNRAAVRKSKIVNGSVKTGTLVHGAKDVYSRKPKHSKPVDDAFDEYLDDLNDDIADLIDMERDIFGDDF